MSDETTIEVSAFDATQIPPAWRGFDQHGKPIDMRDWHHYSNPVVKMARRTVLICVSDDAGVVHKLYAGLDECAGSPASVDWGGFRVSVCIESLKPNAWAAQYGEGQ